MLISDGYLFEIESEKNMQEILYRDQFILIANKPAGLVVHGTLDRNRENLVDLLKSELNLNYLGMIHRLDKDTSGVILFTLCEEANAPIQELLDKRELKKTYLGLVSGLFQWSGQEEVWEDFLKKEKVKRIEMMIKVFKGGQKAITILKSVQNFNDCALLKMELVTGRMHQLRVQNSIRNHPILGDVIYGNQNANEARLYLHASQINFIHPINKLPVSVEAPLPNQFKERMKK